jgi:hypothetical protein
VSTLATALIVAVVAPAVMATLTAWIGWKSKRQDWARQDEVAARVEKVSTTLETQGAVTTDKLAELAKTVGEVHTMSDGVLTIAKENLLESYRAQLGTLDQLSDIQVAIGRKPNVDADAARKTLAEKIELLQKEVTERAKVFGELGRS